MDVALSLLNYLVAGEITVYALCTALARQLHASAAGHIVVDPASRTATVTVWMRDLDVADINVALTQLPQALPLLMHHLATERRPSCLSAHADPSTHDGTVAAELMRDVLSCEDVAQVPLNSLGPTVRAAVLLRQQDFQQRDLHVLECLREPIAALERYAHVHGAPPGLARRRGADDQSPALLTSREVEILRLVAEGLLATTIAVRLDVSPRTVHKHLGNIYRKLDAHDRLIAVRRAEELGLLSQRNGAGTLEEGVVLTLGW